MKANESNFKEFIIINQCRLVKEFSERLYFIGV
jgi:hypothetical protein